MFGTKLLPVCPKPVDPEKVLIEEWNDELYRQNIDEYLPPVSTAIGMTAAAIVSLSPEEDILGQISVLSSTDSLSSLGSVGIRED